MLFLRKLLALACLCVMTYSWSGQAAASEVVWLALSDSGGPYLEAADAARREAQRGGATVEMLP